MIVEHQESGVGGGGSVSSRVECAAGDNRLKMSTANFDTLFYYNFLHDTVHVYDWWLLSLMKYFYLVCTVGQFLIVSSLLDNVIVIN